MQSLDRSNSIERLCSQTSHFEANLHTMRLLLIGFGSVGQELARILLSVDRHHPRIQELNLTVTGITTRTKGSLASPSGVDLRRALSDLGQFGVFQPENPDLSDVSSRGAVQTLEYDVLVELSTLEIASRGEPARGFIEQALRRGKDCVTANKGPVAFAFQELRALARTNRRHLLYESTVMDGAPVFNLARHCLAGARILSLGGVLNSTSNFILTEMESGGTFDKALLEAQVQGFAEADPSNDIDGWDAAAKLAVLSNVLMGANIDPGLVIRQGIRQITPADIGSAVARNERLRLIAAASRKASGEIEASVGVQSLPRNHPFSIVQGSGSVLRITTDLMSPLYIQQESPSVRDTAYGILNDLLELAAINAGSIST